MFASTQIKTQIEVLGYFDVLKNKRAVFGLMSLFMSQNLFTYVDTTLADKLEADFNLSAPVVSLIYASQCFGFLLTSPLAHKAIDRYDCIAVMLIAEVVQVFATLMIGPSQIFPNELWISVTGLVLAGMAIPFTLIPSYQELLDAV